jgi:hypothetical protein
MSDRPTLSSRDKRELEAVGLGVEGQPQVSPRPRDKGSEKTVRSNSHHHQPKKDKHMETATTREHAHIETTNAAEPDPIRVGQQLDLASKKISEMHARQLAQDTPKEQVKRAAIGFGVAFAASALAHWGVSWLLNRKKASVAPEASLPAPIPIASARRAA